MQYIFDTLNEESLFKLYKEYGLRSIEIGSLVGVTDGAVLKRLKQYNIPINAREKKRIPIEIIYTGKKKDKRKALSDEDLLQLCKKGYSDKAIGEEYNLTGEGVAYRRKRLGIDLSMKFNKTRDSTEKLKNIPKDILAQDYYTLNQEKFSSKYGISKTVWRPHLKNLDITGKEKHRIESYPSFNKEQRTLIIGSLLGDGSVSEKTFYYEFHAFKQELYLQKKYKILEPYSSNIYKDETGIRFQTVHHPNFKEFYDVFYEDGVKGKLIPVDFISKNWHDHILAYWYFDDGYYNDEINEFSIYNKSPYPEHALKLVEFLESYYGWKFYYSTATFQLTFSKEYYNKFVNILLQVATPDLYYKIPEAFITNEMVKSINILSCKNNIYPKFYRKLVDPIDKRVLENKLFNQLKSRAFPYAGFTGERRIYLLNIFKKYRGFNIKEDKLICNTSGMSLCEYYFPNIYECKRKGYKSPLELWGEEDFIQRLVQNRLNYADRFTDSSLRTGIKILSKVVSNFKPTIARFLYQKYAPGGKVYDYCSGFGSRMLAALSLDMEYVGCEPNLKTYANLLKFGGFLKEHSKGSFFILDKGSEEFIYKESYFDFAFSSPPFFDYEIYSEDIGQSIIKFPNYEDWLIGFWKKTIENCFKSIIPGGFFGVCISLNKHEHMIQKTKEFCENLNLTLVEEYKALYKQLFHANEKYDLIMIFKK